MVDRGTMITTQTGMGSSTTEHLSVVDNHTLGGPGG